MQVQKSQPLRLPAAAARETRANITENVGAYLLRLTRGQRADYVSSPITPLSLHWTEFYFILLTDICAAPKA